MRAHTPGVFEQLATPLDLVVALPSTCPPGVGQVSHSLQPVLYIANYRQIGGSKCRMLAQQGSH
jgi:hypothetical protein